MSEDEAEVLGEADSDDAKSATDPKRVMRRRAVAAVVVLLIALVVWRSIPRTGPTVAAGDLADTGCAGMPERTLPSRDAWLTLTQDGSVAVDDLRGESRNLTSIEIPETDEDTRWSIGARLDGEFAWIFSSAPASQIAWKVALATGDTTRFEIESSAEPRIGPESWDVMDDTAVFLPGDGSLVVVDGEPGTRDELSVPDGFEARATILRGKDGTWFVGNRVDNTGIGNRGDDGAENRWEVDSDISLSDPLVDGDCLWLATGVVDGCQPGVAAFRLDQDNAVLSRTFSDECISTVDVSDGQVVVGTTGGHVRSLDPASGDQIRREKLFDCGDGVRVLARAGRILAADDCDGVLAELTPDGIRTDDIISADPEPMDFIGYFEWPWMIAGSYDHERLYLLTDEATNPISVPNTVSLLIPV